MKRPSTSFLSTVSSIAILGLTFLVAIGCSGQPADANSADQSSADAAKTCSAGGSADTAAFAQTFSSVEFGNGTASSTEGGQQFTASDRIIVVAQAGAPATARLCAQERSQSGTIVYDREPALTAGENRIEFGPVTKKGMYVVRVRVGDKLVRNLPFEVK